MAGGDPSGRRDRAEAPVVADSSPLIGLERVGRIELLGALADRVLVPPAAIKELGRTPWPVWIVERDLQMPIDPRVREARLDSREEEAIALALELGARRLVVDDLRARRLALSLGVPIVGTAGVLLSAKQAGMVPSIAPIIDALLATGFRLGAGVIAEALAAAGE